MTDPATDETTRTYDRIAAQFAERNFSNVSARFAATREAFARAIVGNAPAERFRILDAGCGPGRDSKWFREKGFQVIGVDNSAGMLAEAVAATRGRLVWPVSNRYGPLTPVGASTSSPMTLPDTQGRRSES